MPVQFRPAAPFHGCKAVIFVDPLLDNAQEASKQHVYYVTPLETPDARAADLSTALLGSGSGAGDSDAAKKMKLVLLKPGNGHGVKELLKKMEAAKGLGSSSGAAAAGCAPI